MTTYRLRTGVTSGRVSAGGLGTHQIENHIVEVDDYETAVRLVDLFSHLEWDAPEGDPHPDRDVLDADDDDSDAVVTSDHASPTRETPLESTPDSDESDSDSEDADSSDDEADPEDDDDICGTEKSDGSICERDPAECPYH